MAACLLPMFAQSDEDPADWVPPLVVLSLPYGILGVLITYCTGGLRRCALTLWAPCIAVAWTMTLGVADATDTLALVYTFPFTVAAAFLGWAAIHRPKSLGDRCIVCGYSLVGIPAARCPECGTDDPMAVGHRTKPRWSPRCRRICAVGHALMIPAGLYLALHVRGVV